jgi:hypothetical protein
MNTKARVPSTETGVGTQDGRATGIRMPEVGGRQKTTEAGRHATGQRTANVGTIRGGQSEPDGNHPITGVPKDAPIRSMAPIPSIPANQAETSRDLEKRLMAPPQPFTYEGGAATLLPGSVRWENAPGCVPYGQAVDVDARTQTYGHAPMSKAEMEAAASVDGMPSSAGVNSVNSGFPTRPPRQAGMPGTRNTNSSGRANRLMRQEP